MEKGGRVEVYLHTTLAWALHEGECQLQALNTLPPGNSPYSPLVGSAPEPQSRLWTNDKFLHLGTLLFSHSSPLHWAFKWRRNCPRVVPTGRCYCTHSSCSTTLLRHVFRDRIISKGIWLSQSPDLAHPDYCMWGAVESAVHKDNSHTLRELTESIVDCICNIPPAAFLRACLFKRDETRRVDACLQAREGSFPTFLQLSAYEKCICINLHELFQYTQRIQ
jgi:hypothetical protein